MSPRGFLKGQTRRAVSKVVTWASPPGPATPTPPTERPDPIHVSALFLWCQANGSTTRPHYLWSVLQAARSASSLGIDRFSALEFGVAGGNGLLQLEEAAAEAEHHYDVAIDVVGFDTGSGMPEPADHRDVPWAIRAGLLQMDEPALRARLTRADLVLGPVADTVPRWLDGLHAPVGFAAFDLDYHSATVDAFTIFDADESALLPRVICYLDDIFGYGWNEFNGERAAVAEFNDAHAERKIAAIPGLKYELSREHFYRPWPEQLYLAHILDHGRYNDFEDVVSEAFLSAHRLLP